MSIIALPELPYAKNAFAPFLSEESFDFHYGKHHAAYVNNLLTKIKGTKYEHLLLLEIIFESAKEKETAIFNNAAQHFNHTFFWETFTPNSVLPQENTKFFAAITNKFGSLENLKAEIVKTAVSLFGSGWVWLVKNSNDELEIIPTANAGMPLTEGKMPLLVVDVWEHAYYIDYRNARQKFVETFWNYINWSTVNLRFMKT